MCFVAWYFVDVMLRLILISMPLTFVHVTMDVIFSVDVAIVIISLL